MRKCCIYCRIDGSPSESNQDAMKNQLHSLREAAVSLGLTIAAEIAVFESGIDPLRQSIKTMIRDGRHGFRRNGAAVPGGGAVNVPPRSSC